MAKATAQCTCKTCGKIYTATKICRNRRDADEWEQWATEHYDECPECYKARKQAEQEEANEQAARETTPQQTGGNNNSVTRWTEGRRLNRPPKQKGDN